MSKSKKKVLNVEYQSTDKEIQKINLILLLPIKKAEYDNYFENNQSITQTVQKKHLTKNNSVAYKLHSIELSSNENQMNFNVINTDQKQNLSNYKTLENHNSNFVLSKLKVNSDNWVTKTDKRCWWCTYKFDNNPCSIPVEYNKITQEFTVYGCFCSFNCAKAYIILNSMSNEHIEKISLLQLLYFKMNNKLDNIEPAPPKEILEDYGGNMTIDNYRLLCCHEKMNYEITIPPINSVKPFVQLRNIGESVKYFQKKPFYQNMNEDPDNYSIDKNIKNNMYTPSSNQNKKQNTDTNIAKNDNFMKFFIAK